jgi:hypothetical protein
MTSKSLSIAGSVPSIFMTIDVISIMF